MLTKFADAVIDPTMVVAVSRANFRIATANSAGGGESLSTVLLRTGPTGSDRAPMMLTVSNEAADALLEHFATEEFCECPGC